MSISNISRKCPNSSIVDANPSKKRKGEDSYAVAQTSISQIPFPRDFKELQCKVVHLKEDHKNQEAEQLIDAFLVNNADHIPAQEMKMNFLWQRGIIEKVKELVCKILEIDTASCSALSIKMALEFKNNQFKTAFLTANQILSIHPENYKALFIKAQILFLFYKKPAEALLTIELALKVFPSSVEALKINLRILCFDKQFDASFKLIEQFFQKNPGEYGEKLFFALVKNRMEQEGVIQAHLIQKERGSDEAIIYINENLSHNDNAQLFKAMLIYNQERAEAHAIIDSILKKNDRHPNALLFKSNFSFEEGKMDDAMNFLNAIFMIGSDFVMSNILYEAYSLKARFLCKQKKWDEAIRVADSALQLNPDRACHVKTINAKAYSLLQLNRIDEGVQMIDMIQSKSKNDASMIHSMEGIYDACCRMKNYRKGIDLMDKFLVDYPDHPELLILKAKLMYEWNNFLDEALSIVDQILREQSDHRNALILKIKLIIKLKRTSVATIDLIKKCLEAHPNDFDFLHLQRQALMNIGN